MNIMVCYDGSTEAKAAARFARKTAKALQATLHILTCLGQSEQLDYREIEKAERRLRDEQALCGQDRVACETRTVIEDLSPGESLLAYAREHRIDEIYVGVQKKSKVGKLLFGSTVQYLILEAECPVVAVK